MSLLLFVLVAAGGGVIAWSWWRVAQQSKIAANWPRASGTVTRCELAQTRDTQGDTVYLPDIRYSYSVNGEQFEGSRVRFGLMRQDLAGANAIRGRYPQGSSVEVFYNPAKSHDSVLEAGAAR
jgi:hypothetical protein